MNQIQICIRCHNRFPTAEVRYACTCGGLIAIETESQKELCELPKLFDSRLGKRSAADRSGVWRFREAILDIDPVELVAHPEGNTNLYTRRLISEYAGIDRLYLKHEGENPTGSFKDRGMTVAITAAKRMGAAIAGCASTGNTSASLAAYAAHAGMKSLVFLPFGKVSTGKLAQAIGYGAHCLAIRGDFDDAMNLVQSVAGNLGVYLVNSLNPFRIEGQKTIVWELLQDLAWQSPDWIAVPGGNLGNTSAFGKAIDEAFRWGWIKSKPRIATIQSEGANPFFLSYKAGFQTRFRVQASTYATAIQIGNPVNFERAIGAIRHTNGVVAQVSEEDIRAAKLAIDRCGIGCEPASACTLAGIRQLRAAGTIKKDDTVVGILTGNMLKDPEAIVRPAEISKIEAIEPDLSKISKKIDEILR